MGSAMKLLARQQTDVRLRLCVGLKRRENFFSSRLILRSNGMKKSRSLYDYGKCHVCGERMEERLIKQEFWIKRKLIVVEDIPAGVCPQCGEKVVRANIGRLIAVL